MGRFFRIKLRFRRFLRRHSWVATIIRSFTIFSIAFGSAFGFISGALSQQSGYDPNTFAIGVSFLFALACLWIVTLGIRLRLMRTRLRTMATHKEAMADANWKLQESDHVCSTMSEEGVLN